MLAYCFNPIKHQLSHFLTILGMPIYKSGGAYTFISSVRWAVLCLASLGLPLGCKCLYL